MEFVPGIAKVLPRCNKPARSFGKTPKGLIQKGTPGRIRTIIRGRHRKFATAKHVGHKNLRAVLPAGIAKEHQIKAVRGPGRPLVVKAFGEDPLARSIWSHDPDRE